MPAPTGNTKAKTDWSAFGARSAEEREVNTEGEYKWSSVVEGDVVIGTLKAPKNVNTKFGEKVVLTLSNVQQFISNGEKTELIGDDEAIIWATPGLLDAMLDAAAAEGDVVTVLLDELVDTGKGNPFKRFTVSIA